MNAQHAFIFVVDVHFLPQSGGKLIHNFWKRFILRGIEIFDDCHEIFWAKIAAKTKKRRDNPHR